MSREKGRFYQNWISMRCYYLLSSHFFSCKYRLKNKIFKNFKKIFYGGFLFVVIEYLCNRRPKMKIKHFKNCASILSIVNHRNWLDASLPLKTISANSMSELVGVDMWLASILCKTKKKLFPYPSSNKNSLRFFKSFV